MRSQRVRISELAAEGNRWAVAAEAGLRTKGRAWIDAMDDAADIRHWTDGPNAPGWRIYRLAQARSGKADE